MRLGGIALAFAFAVVGCVTSRSVPCGDGRVCPEGTTCHDALKLCVRDDQIEACKGKAEGEPCMSLDQAGACTAGVCVFAIDLDDDGVLDSIDNCVGLANPAQVDYDRDDVGDECDSCPVTANTGQDDYDGDRIGDLCDPRPADPGECLLLVDKFTDPTRFAHDWDVVVNGGGTVENVQGAATLRTDQDGDTAAIVAKGPDGNVLIGDHHVIVVGQLTEKGDGAAIANADTQVLTYTYCAGRYFEGTYLAFLGFPPAIPGYGFNMSSPPLFGNIAMQLHKRIGFELACRVDWGIGVGTIYNAPIQPSPGGSGALVIAGTLTVSAVVLYATQSMCPPVIMR